ASALGVSPDGSVVFVTGYSARSGNDDYSTVAYDTSGGAKLWARRYNGSANGNDFAHAIGVSPDGSRLFVTGESQGFTSAVDYATVAYDSRTGAKLWIGRYNGAAKGNDYAAALGVSPDGSSVFVTGYSTGSAGFYAYATVAYGSSTGMKLWVGRYNGAAKGNDYAAALGVSPDGSSVF